MITNNSSYIDSFVNSLSLQSASFSLVVSSGKSVVPMPYPTNTIQVFFLLRSASSWADIASGSVIRIFRLYCKKRFIIYYIKLRNPLG